MLALQDNVLACGEAPKTAVEGRKHVRPEGVLVETESPTVPVNPLRPVRVIVEEPDTLAGFRLGMTGPAKIVKSVTLTVTVAV